MLLMKHGSESVDDFQLVPDENELPVHNLNSFNAVFDETAFAEVPMLNKIDPDGLYVQGIDYWERITAQRNISDGLKNWLKQCYRV